MSQIKKDWQKIELGEIFTILSGSTPSRQNIKYWKNPSIFWVKTGDLNNSFIYNTDEKISEIGLKESSCKLYPQNTILIAMYGGFNQIGRTGILKIEATTNQAISALLPNKDTNPIFINSMLIYYRHKWKNIAISSRKDPNITKSDIENFKIFLPPLKEQEKIAKILTTWDEAILKQEELIKEKEQLKKGLMQKLLSGEVRFNGFNDEWKDIRLGKYIKEISQKNKDNVYLVLSVTNKYGFIAQKDYFDKEVASKDTSSYKVVRKGNFAYNPSRINVGSIGLLEEYEIGILSPMYVIFECLKGLNKDYFNYWIDTHNFTGNFYKFLTGSVRDSLSFSDLKLMKIKLPSLPEQQKIAEVLSLVDDEINLLENKLFELKQQKKALMQKLLTGETRVKV